MQVNELSCVGIVYSAVAPNQGPSAAAGPVLQHLSLISVPGDLLGLGSWYCYRG